jgi:hypothetical protein
MGRAGTRARTRRGRGEGEDEEEDGEEDEEEGVDAGEARMRGRAETSGVRGRRKRVVTQRE